MLQLRFTLIHHRITFCCVVNVSSCQSDNLPLPKCHPPVSSFSCSCLSASLMSPLRDGLSLIFPLGPITSRTNSITRSMYSWGLTLAGPVEGTPFPRCYPFSQEPGSPPRRQASAQSSSGCFLRRYHPASPTASDKISVT